MEYKMLTEIKEQPEILRKLVDSKKGIFEASELIKKAVSREGNIYLVGNGTSYHACMYGEFLLSVQNKLVIDLKDSSEFKDYCQNLKAEDIVILVSQSGETGDALKLISKIKDKKSKIIVVTNFFESSLAKAADSVVPMQLGACDAIPNTKGYTAVMTIFALISETLRGDNNFSSQVGTLSSDMGRIINLEHATVREIADKIYKTNNIFSLGHASGLSDAYEAALKIKECSHIEAEGYSALEFRHGPSSVVTPGTPVIIFAADYESEEDLAFVMEELKNQGAYLIGVASNQNRFFDAYFKISEHNLYAAIASIVPMQLLAYELALLRGVSPDAPSGVQKVVK